MVKTIYVNFGMWGRVLDVIINHAKFQLDRFRGFGATDFQYLNCYVR